MPSPLPEALDSDMPSQEQWSPDEQPTDGLPPPHSNGTGDQMSQVLENDGVDYSRGGDGDDVGNDSKTGSPYRDQQHERQMKPNKVYIGGLPEHTRREDLQSCFGKIGTIVNIELKIGYGFVEFENIQAAEESVAKYNEGYFMGNKIRVEISRGGRQKYQSEPGACFKCGQMGHWARECPNHGTVSVPGTYDPTAAHGVNRTRRPFHSHGAEPPLIDRIHPAREYPPPAPREYPTPPYREEYGRGYPPPPPPPRDARYGYDYPPPPSRDVRRASPPPAAYRPPPPPRDYPPPPVRTGRDYDDYRMRGPPPPPVRYDAPPPGYFPPERGPAGYPPSGYPPPPPRDYERYDKRTVPPPTERYGAYPPPGAVRPRTPPGVAPVRIPREEFERTVTPREYPGAPPPDFRGRPVTPPAARYADYVPPRAASPTGGAMRYRRRSQSPMTRSASGGVAYDPNYAPPPPERFNNGYSAPGVPPMPQRGGARDYAPRNGREVPDPNAGYRRA